MVRLVVASLVLAGLGLSAPVVAAPRYTPELGQAGKDVPWVPTPERLVERMLTMAQVGPGDVVVDLGSGDGRVVIAAAKKFGARAIGIEFNPELVALARRRAAAAGVDPRRVRFVRGDVLTTDFQDATVVTIYMAPAINRQLRPKLLSLRPGTRIVSHQFALGDWEPDETSWLGARSAHLWIVPAAVAGRWQVELPEGRALELEFEQHYQQLRGRARFGEIHAGLREAYLRGDVIRFRLVDQDGALLEFTGRVSGDRIRGTVYAGGRARGWTATRARAPEP